MNRLSAVIVAGGLNSRMGGKNKAFLQIGGQTILSRLIAVLEKEFDEILIVTKNPSEYSSYTTKDNFIRTVSDLYGDRASLTGIHAGIYHAKNHFCFIVPCDAPFIQRSLIRLLVDSIEPETDVVIPYYDGYYQPLCAIYSKSCLPAVEELLKKSDYRIFNFFNKINLKRVGKDKLEQADPQMLSFVNVNTPEAFEESLKVKFSDIEKKI